MKGFNDEDDVDELYYIPRQPEPVSRFTKGTTSIACEGIVDTIMAAVEALWLPTVCIAVIVIPVFLIFHFVHFSTLEERKAEFMGNCKGFSEEQCLTMFRIDEIQRQRDENTAAIAAMAAGIAASNSGARK